MSHVPDTIQDYWRRGFRLIFFPARSKGPRDRGWIARTSGADDWQDGLNVGTFTGHEIEPGKFLADVDLDWAPGVAMGRGILPETEFGFGRPSKKLSHLFYTTPTAVTTKKYASADGKTTYVELRGIGSAGKPVHETMLPPSTHPNGEVLELAGTGPLLHVEAGLEATVRDYAIACLFLDVIGPRGFGHDLRLATAGTLLKLGLPEGSAVRIMRSLATATGNDADDAVLTVRSTVEAIEGEKRTVGKTQLVKLLGDVGNVVLGLLRSWLNISPFELDNRGRPDAGSQENIRRALEMVEVAVSFDEFSDRYMSQNGTGSAVAIDDPALKDLWLKVDKRFNFRPPLEFFQTVVEHTARQRIINPVIEYLAGLRWDGVPRVESWLVRYGKAHDTAFVRAVGQLVLVAAVKRARCPGCKFDELLVLGSGQGMLKSTALQLLCPHPDWFSDDIPLGVDSKQMIERTRGKWLIEAAELSGMHRSQVEQLKASLSRQVDGPVRMAYDRAVTERKRSFIIIGTTNSEQYLKDMTGNRRFWPVAVGRFDIEGLRGDREQLWAEAAQLEGQGAPTRLDAALYGAAAAEQENRAITDPWEHAIDEATAAPPDFFKRKDGALRATNAQLLAFLGITVDRQTAVHVERLGAIMARLNFRYASVRDDDKQVRKGWIRRPTEFGQQKLPEEGE